MNNIDLKSLSASRMRLVLIAAVVVSFLAQAGLVFLGQSAIDSYSADVATAVELSSTNSKTLQDLEVVSNTLKDHKTTVEKSDKLVVDNDDVYEYQNEIIAEITQYAVKSQLLPTGFAFTSAEAPPGAAPAAAAPAAPAAGATTPAAATAPSGVTPVEVSVTFAPGATYEQLYTFLRLLEGSLLRLEVGTLNLSRPATEAAPDAATPANAIGLSTLNIKAYKKQ